jgi:thymidylate synthase (FAD)
MEKQEFKVLDHGYVRSIEQWGSEERIIEAARMSTQKGFLGWGPIDCPRCDGGRRRSAYIPGSPSCSACSGNLKVPGDEKLLAYLWKNKHATPFEMAGLTIEVQAPIFVFREWHRHRVPFGYNEMSSRYAPLPDVNYIPTIERIMMGGGHLTKQAAATEGAEELTIESAAAFRDGLAEVYRATQGFYEASLSAGIPKELARVHLPVGRYSRMRATGNLRGWLAFLSLRSTPQAQYEIRVYAEAVGEIIAVKFPRTWALFSEGREAKS